MAEYHGNIGIGMHTLQQQWERGTLAAFLHRPFGDEKVTTIAIIRDFLDFSVGFPPVIPNNHQKWIV